MKTRLLVVLVLLGLAATARSEPASAASATPPADAERVVREGVLAANTAMIDAANRFDLDTFFGFMTESGTPSVVQNGVIFQTRPEARQAVERGLRGITKIERAIENPQVTVLGPDAALLVGEGSVTATGSDGRVMTGRFAVSLVFVRRAGAWKLLHGHYSIPPRT